ncbi:MAG TPA: histidine kinase [Nocardioides sp.]|nr:histidine kinase [Nocardioides sp.]
MLVAIVVASVASLLVAQQMSEKIALRTAEARGEAFARGVAAPLVNEAVRNGEPDATELFSTVMNNRINAGSIMHMKVWGIDGTVLWADEQGLIGKQFDLDPPVKAQAGNEFVHSEVSTLDQPENQFELSAGRLVEVYVGATDADGVPVIIETYWSAAGIHADERRVLWEIAPLSLGSILLLMALMLPVAVNLARNANRSVLERNRVLSHALGAADLERSRIAQMLHDGVIQDLAGLGFALPSASSRIRDESELDSARQIVDNATEVIRNDLTTLRTLLADIYPPSLALGELATAINELASSAERSGLVVSVELQTEQPLGHATNQLAYRIVREGLLNVVKHTTATRAWVVIRAVGDVIQVSVRDNGPGAEPVVIADPQSGHIGLRLLFDAVADQGGELSVRPADEGGTVLIGTFPVPQPDL